MLFLIADQGLVFGAELIVELAVEYAQAALSLQAEADLDQAELYALEAGGGAEILAEIDEGLRRHGFEDIDHAVQLLEDFDDAAQVDQDRLHIALVDDVARKAALDVIQLEEDLLEPQLVDLVELDEQHFVMRRPVPGRAARMLRVQQCVQIEIVSVLVPGCLVYHSRQFMRRGG